MGKRLMVGVAGLVLLFGVAMVAAQGSTEEEGSATVQRAVFRVENLSCGACLSKINAALDPVAGFSGMGANLFRKMVAVDFAAPLSPEKIGEIITGLGYPAALDTVEALTEKQTFAYMRSRSGGRGYGGSCCGGGPAPQQSTVQCPGTGCVIPPASATTSTDS